MGETRKRDKKRDASLDLLRILSMLLIILMHSIDHTGVLEKADLSGGWIAFLVRFLYMLTQASVNCYVMLSGYFLVISSFRLQKVVALWLETAFYAFFIRLAFILTGERAFSLLSLISCFFPILTGRYWFITIYLGLYLLSPFLNMAIKAMDRKQHGMLVITLVFLFSVLDSVHPSISGMNSGGGWGLAWFVVLYFSAAWFRLYREPKNSSAVLVFLWLALAAFTAASYSVAGERSALVRTVSRTWFQYNSLPAFVSTAALFEAFRGIRIKRQWISRLICFLAPSTLGVYLIHIHADLSPYIWSKLDLPSKMGNPGLYGILIGSVLLIYLGCTLLDLLRSRTIGRAETSKLVMSICVMTERRAAGLLERLFSHTERERIDRPCPVRIGLSEGQMRKKSDE